MVSEKVVRVLAISGSLRQASYNTMLLNAAVELAPEGMTIDVFDGLADIPPYDDDVRALAFPPPVEALRNRVRDADALLIANPEYNRSISGVLKNAIDWVSRPPDQPFAGKTALVTGASPGMLGTALGNYHVRQILSVVNVHILPGLELLVGSAATKFDDDRRLTDEATRKLLSGSLIRLRKYTIALQASE